MRTSPVEVEPRSERFQSLRGGADDGVQIEDPQAAHFAIGGPIAPTRRSSGPGVGGFISYYGLWRWIIGAVSAAGALAILMSVALLRRRLRRATPI